MAHLELAKRRTKNKRKAFLVGIDEYANPANNLRGCVNDCKDIGNTLLILGFPPTRIRYLTNKNATKQRILNGLEWLVQDAKEGDVLIFSYSGHGSQVTDLDNDEYDLLDEVILPTDFSFSGKTYITDDELYEYFTNKVPLGSRCEVLLDCCHSGTGTRSLLHPGGTNLTATARYIPPPLEIEAKINTMIPKYAKQEYFGDSIVQMSDEAPKPAAKGGKKILQELREKQQHNVLWAAAQDFQLAWELNIGGEIRGAFTHSIMQILRRCNGNKTRKSIYQILRTHMFNQGYDQVPDLEVPTEVKLDRYPFRRPIEDDPTKVPEE